LGHERRIREVRPVYLGRLTRLALVFAFSGQTADGLRRMLEVFFVAFIAFSLQTQIINTTSDRFYTESSRRSL
jgi:hypothetical protein